MIKYKEQLQVQQPALKLTMKILKWLIAFGFQDQQSIKETAVKKYLQTCMWQGSNEDLRKGIQML